MNATDRVAVCSRSFSRSATLRAELQQRYAHVTFNDAGVQLEGDALVGFLRGHHKAITALERIDEHVLASLPELQVVAKYGVGLDMIDLEAMRRRGRKLGWAAGVNRRSVAELALAFMIVLLRKVPEAYLAIRQGAWRQFTGNQLSGKTVGIVGCGNIGKDLVCLLQPFRCRVLVNDILRYEDFYREHDVEPAGLDHLIARADVVTLHVPLDESTRGILDARRIALMKRSAVLVNTARGGLVDETAVRIALQKKRIAGAAFDVFSQEPPADPVLLELPGFLATPHIGGSAAEAILAMGRAAIDALDINAVP